MALDRRRLLTMSALSSAVPVAMLATPAAATPQTALGVDATALGVRAGGGADQSAMLQDAIDRTAGARVALVLGPGDYRASSLRLPSGAQIVGVRGATRLVLSGTGPLIGARGADHVTLSNLVFDGGDRPLPAHAGLVHLIGSQAVRLTDCEVLRAGGNAIVIERSDGEIAGCAVDGAADAAIFARDATGLSIRGNLVRNAGNNGILVWRSENGDDGTIVADNRIEDIANRRGGSGQYGNAVNVFRAANVQVRGNRIARAAFSAVRGNAASNLQVAGNNIVAVGEVAIYAEFGFEGATIAGNTIDGAALGIVATNFNEGGRLAVVQGNLIRNLTSRRPAGTDPTDSAGVGIAVEADASVTGNVVENAPYVGISVGWGRHQRDVAVTGNVVRETGYGIALSVAGGAGAAVVSGNLIAGARRGAVVGMDHAHAVTGDLTREPVRHANIEVSGNRVR